MAVAAEFDKVEHFFDDTAMGDFFGTGPARKTTPLCPSSIAGENVNYFVLDDATNPGEARRCERRWTTTAGSSVRKAIQHEREDHYGHDETGAVLIANGQFKLISAQ